MKHRLGILVTLCGILFLVSPLQEEELVESVRISLYQYWPIGLIIFGVYLSSDSKKRHRKR